MLVLTRKLGEGIAIGDSIKVVVMQIKGKQVRLGIQAESSTPVHREEIYTKIKEENQLAQHTAKHSLVKFEKIADSSFNSDTFAPVVRRKKKDPHV